MAKRPVAVSRATGDAVAVLANQIKIARVRRGWTVADLAGRIGVTPKTLYAVEAGSASTSIGTVFNAAFTVGVNLFGLEGADLARARRAGDETLALLPTRVRHPIEPEASDDFAF